MKTDLMDWDGQRSHAFYENFKITDEAVRKTIWLFVSNYFLWFQEDIICRFQDKYRLQYGLYSGKAGDALTGGSGMIEQWSACLSGMQFSTRDQVSHVFF